MTRQETIEKIRQACIASNPSILDLKFGCEIKTKKWFYDGTSEWICGTSHNGDSEMTWYASLRGNQEIKREEITKIIGRPLQLSDILLAMEQKTRKINFFYSYDLPGHFCIGYYKDAYRWNLPKPFEEQSDEVIDFISNLI